jgi:hypothetical protein
MAQTTFGASDYLTTDVIDNVYAAQYAIVNKYMRVLNRIVYITRPDTSKGVYTIPFPEFINVIERNIDALTAGGYMPLGMGKTVDWMGELFDLRRLDYTDVNRWFESAEMIDILIDSIADRTPLTGNCTAGGDRTRQLLRTVG